MRDYIAFETVSIRLQNTTAPNWIIAAADKDEADQKIEITFAYLRALFFDPKVDYRRRDYLLLDKRNLTDLIDAWALGNNYQFIDWTRFTYPWFYFPDQESHNKGGRRKSPRCYWSHDCPGKGKAKLRILGDTSRLA
jgi:hypothetical protein